MANETKIVISAETAKAEIAMRSLGSSLDGVSRKMLDFSGVAGTLGGALTLTAFAGFIKSSIDAADQLSKLAQKTGTTVEALAGLKFAAEQNDVSLESTANAAKKLATNIADNPELFKKFGITAKDTTGALVQMADIFAAMPDGVDKSALATKLLGKALGDEMIPFLNQGSAELQRLIEKGQAYNPVTEESAKQAQAFNDQLKELQASSSTLGVNLANELLPSLNDIVKAMIEARKESGLVMTLWVGMGGVAAHAFGVDDESKRTDRINELKNQIGTAQKQLESETLNPGGKSLFSFLIPNIKLSNDGIESLRKNLAAMKAELAVLEASPVAQKPAGVKQDGKGRSLYGAMGGGGKDDKVLNAPKDFNPDADYQFAIDEARRKNNKKAQEDYLRDMAKAEEDANRELQRSALEAQAIIFDIEPIAKATHEWEKLLALKEQGLLTDEQIGKIYAKNFGQADAKAVEEAQRIILDIDPVARATAEWEKLTALKERGLLTDEQMGKAYKKAFADLEKDGNEAFKSLEAAIRGWGNEFSDTFTKMVRTGKADFRSLADSIINDLIRIQAQEMIKPVLKEGSSWISSAFSSFFGSTGGTSAAATDTTAVMASMGIPGFATGIDYVPRDMLAYIHKGERVVPAAQNTGGAGVVVNVIESSSKAGQVQQRNDGGANVIDVFVAQVKASIAGDITRGQGDVPAAMSRTFGLNRVAGAY